MVALGLYLIGRLATSLSKSRLASLGWTFKPYLLLARWVFHT
jgi:hypothetical protein